MSYQTRLKEAQRQINEAMKDTASSKVIMLQRISKNKWQYQGDQVFTETELLEEFKTPIPGRVIVLMDFGKDTGKQFKPSQLVTTSSRPVSEHVPTETEKRDALQAWSKPMQREEPLEPLHEPVDNDSWKEF